MDKSSDDIKLITNAFMNHFVFYNLSNETIENLI
jgi:hypothetical protein